MKCLQKDFPKVEEILEQERKLERDKKELEEIKKPFFLLAGVGGGMIASLSGLGGGVLMMPIFTSFLKIDIKKAKAVSLGVITLTALIVTIFNLFEQFIFCSFIDFS